MGNTDLALLAGLGFVILMITKNPFSDALKDISTLPPQEVTSPKQDFLFGLRSTNTLGLIDSAPGLTPLQTGLANLRDNLTFGGLLFQGTNNDITTTIKERILDSSTSLFNIADRRIR